MAVKRLKEISQWKRELENEEIGYLTDALLKKLTSYFPLNAAEEGRVVVKDWKRLVRDMTVYTAQYLPLSFYQSFFVSRMRGLDVPILGEPIPMALPSTGCKIKVGILVCDLTRRHPLPAIVLPWVRHLKEAMDVVIFDTSTKRERNYLDNRYFEHVQSVFRKDHIDLRSETSTVIRTSQQKEQKLRIIAERIAKEKLNVFLDLSGVHTERGMPHLLQTHGNRLGEICVLHGVGLAVTSGCQNVDAYYATDSTSVPEISYKCFTERLFYLPGTYFHVGFSEMFPHMMKVKRFVTTNGNTVVLNSMTGIPDFEQEEIDEIGSILILREDQHIYKHEVGGRQIVVRYFQDTDPKKLETSLADIQEGLATWSQDEIIVTARCQYGLPEDKKVVANFNGPSKWTISEWLRNMEVLDRCEDAVLWVRAGKSSKVRDNLNVFATNLREDRIFYTHDVCKEEHLRRLQLVDVVTDCFPNNGHTTNADSLFAGVPVVTREFQNGCKPSRVSQSILIKGLKLPVLVATDEDDYVDRIVYLLTNQHWADDLREEIKNRVSKMNMFRPKVTAEIMSHVFEKLLRIKRSNDRNTCPLKLDDDIIQKIESYEADVPDIRVQGVIPRDAIFGTIPELRLTKDMISQGIQTGRQETCRPPSAMSDLPGPSSKLAKQTGSKKGRQKIDPKRSQEADEEEEDDGNYDSKGREQDQQEENFEDEGDCDNSKDESDDQEKQDDYNSGDEEEDSDDEQPERESEAEVELVREKARLMVYRIREVQSAAEDVLAHFLRKTVGMLDTGMSTTNALAKIHDYSNTLFQIEEENGIFVSANSFLLKIEHNFPGSVALHFCPLCKEKSSRTTLQSLLNHYDEKHSYKNKSQVILDRSDVKVEVRDAVSRWAQSNKYVFGRGLIAYHQSDAFWTIPEVSSYQILRNTKDKKVEMNYGTKKPKGKPPNYCSWIPILHPSIEKQELESRWTIPEDERSPKKGKKKSSSSTRSTKEKKTSASTASNSKKTSSSTISKGSKKRSRNDSSEDETQRKPSDSSAGKKRSKTR